MRVLLLSKYERGGASSRLRFYQYVPGLRARGVDVEARPLFSDVDLARYYRGEPHGAARLARRALARLRALLAASRADVVWLEAEVWPFLPAFAEGALTRAGVPFVVDYDDAVFHKYDRHRSAAVRLALGRKIDAVMRRASVVVAGNAYIADRARAAGARKVEIVPTVVDPDRYRPAPPRSEGPPRVGWIGTPETVGYLDVVARPLRRLVDDGAATVRLVGVERGPLGERAEHRPWSEETEADEIAAFDVGIMPLPDTPWTRGKCGYKLLQYMACGLPVVASPVGVNTGIVAAGRTGFLAGDEGEWTAALRALVDDVALRRRMGEAGRAVVEDRYSLARWAPEIARILQQSGSVSRA